MRGVLLGVVLGVTILGTGCGLSDYDWQRATAINTLASYQAFLKSHPKSPQAKTARGFILALQEEQAWKAATTGHSQQSYRAYLAAYPGGADAERARFEITALQRAAAWEALQQHETYATLKTFLALYPEGLESNLARGRLASMSYRAKFADESTRSAANRRRSALQRRLRDTVESLIVIPPSATDKDYEVTSSVLSQAQARAVCAAATHLHQRCEVLPSAELATQS